MEPLLEGHRNGGMAVNASVHADQFATTNHSGKHLLADAELLTL
jgi:hypothetical protein